MKDDDAANLSGRTSGSWQAQDINRTPSPSNWVQLNENSETLNGARKRQGSLFSVRK